MSKRGRGRGRGDGKRVSKGSEREPEECLVSEVAHSGLRTLRFHVAGIDIGSEEHYVCGPALASGKANIRVFSTTTKSLNELADWLIEQKVESVAMESTHVYWIPVYELLESRGLEVLLVNSRQLKNVSGRKSDLQDCQWIQILHSCGLLAGSFRPSESICQLRALHRQRKQLIEKQVQAVQWMQKACDQMNVQVHRAVTAITGKTGMSIVRAIVAGERDPSTLAQFRDKRCKKSEEEIAEYLTGTWRDEHLFNLASALRVYDNLQKEIEAYDRELNDVLVKLQPEERKNASAPTHPNPNKELAIKRRGEQALRTQLWRFAGHDITRIEGISPSAAAIILTEIGFDLSSFPTEKQFIAWLRLYPNQPVSGGKVLKKRRNGTGANRVAGILRIAALSLHRSKTALGASFRRLARLKSAKVAIFATARKLAQFLYRMLKYGQYFVDEGEAAFAQRFNQKRLTALRRTATVLGYALVPTAEAAK